jgi:hypothetical protein
MRLEIKHLGFSGDIDNGRSSAQVHVGEELALVNLTRFGTRDSDSYRHFVFHQLGQVIVWTVPGDCLQAHVAFGIGPFHSPVNEEYIYLVPLVLGHFGKLKTAGCGFVAVLTEKKKIAGHTYLLIFRHYFNKKKSIHNMMYNA